MALEPRSRFRHHPCHNPQRVLRAEIIPYAIGGEDDDIAVLDRVLEDVSLGGDFGVMRRAAKDGVLSLHSRRDLGELVGSVEGVSLDRGAVSYFPGAEEHEGRVAEAVALRAVVSQK